MTSKFGSIMKAFGKGLLTGVGFVSSNPIVQKGVEGATLAFAGPAGVAIVGIEERLFGIISMVEHTAVVFNQESNGAAKAQIALPLVKEALLGLNYLKGRSVVDPDQFTKAAQGFIDASVALANAFSHPDPAVAAPVTQ